MLIPIGEIVVHKYPDTAVSRRAVARQYPSPRCLWRRDTLSAFYSGTFPISEAALVAAGAFRVGDVGPRATPSMPSETVPPDVSDSWKPMAGRSDTTDAPDHIKSILQRCQRGNRAKTVLNCGAER